MPLINTSLPNLIAGVSQQADVVRYDGQCSTQENALSSIVNGLKKRPPTEYISTLFTTEDDDSDTLKDSYIEFIRRTEDESYCVILDGSHIRIFRVELPIGVDVPTQAEIKVNGITYSDGYPITSSDYIYSATSHQNIKTITIGDTTIIVNTALPVDKGLELSDPLNDAAFLFIKQGDYEKEYKVTLTYPTSTEIFRVESGSNNHGDNASSAEIRDLFFGEDPHNDAEELSPAQNKFYNQATKVGSNGFILNWKSILSGSGETPTSISVSDGLSDSAFGLVYNEVKSISSLPQYCRNNFTVKVKGDAERNEDDYYVKFDTSNKQLYGNGTWSETIAPEVQIKIGTNSPVELVNTAENEFELRGLSFNERLVGDDDLNPFPSFVGKSISNMFLFKNRLGFLAEDFVVLSESGLGATVNATSYYVNSVGDSIHANGYYYPLYLNSSRIYGDYTEFEFDQFPNTKFYRPNSNGGYHATNAPTTGEISFTSEENITVNNEIQGFNFFRTTVTALLDSDPIDVRVSTRKVTNLKSAQAFQENLVIFSEKEQFILKGGDLLTPSTVSITQSTNFDYEATVDPIALGSFIYFPFKRGDYSGIREYSLNATSDVYDSDEITQHVPRYITRDLTDLTGSNKEGLIAATSGNVETTDQGAIVTTFNKLNIFGTSHQFIGGSDLVFHASAFDPVQSMIVTDASLSYTDFNNQIVNKTNQHRIINRVNLYNNIVAESVNDANLDSLFNGVYDQMTVNEALDVGWLSGRPYQYVTPIRRMGFLNLPTLSSSFSDLTAAIPSGSDFTAECFYSLNAEAAIFPAPRIVFANTTRNNLSANFSDILKVGFYENSSNTDPKDNRAFISIYGIEYRSGVPVNVDGRTSVHVLLTGNSDYLSLYINNVLRIKVTASMLGFPLPTLTHDTSDFIGISDDGTNYGTHYVRLYNKRLSSAERAVNFNYRYD